jgi:hypothetical protein
VLSKQNPKIATQCHCDHCDLALYSPSISQRYCRKCKRWFNAECLDALECRIERRPTPKLPEIFDDIDVPDEFLMILIMPICRGGPHGVVGNGSVYLQAKSMLCEARLSGKLPDDWKDIIITADFLQTKDLGYYKCPRCVDVSC